MSCHDDDDHNIIILLFCSLLDYLGSANKQYQPLKCVFYLIYAPFNVKYSGKPVIIIGYVGHVHVLIVYIYMMHKHIIALAEKVIILHIR